MTLPIVFAATDSGLMKSVRTPAEIKLTADPEAAVWKEVPGVIAERGRYGEPLQKARTEIRSRWTRDNLYFLVFVYRA